MAGRLRGQYLYGVRDPSLIEPDNWIIGKALIDRPGVDEIFPEEVVRQILTDHPDAEYHALPTGHFALEDKAPEIARLTRDFLARTVSHA